MFRLLSGNWQSGMCNSLHQLQQNGILCDLVLNLADSKQVQAHSCVMAASSPYLRELLVANKTNSYLHTLNSEAVEMLIAYMYSGELEFTKLLLPDILKAAQMLQMDPLIEELARYHHCFLQSPHRIVSRDGCVRQPDIGSCLYLPTELTPIKRPLYTDDSVSTSSSSDDDSDQDYNGGGDFHNTSFTNSLPDLCLPCEACGKTFKQKGALGMHYKSHIIEATNAKGEIEMISCKACGASLKKGVHFLVHLKQCTKREKFRLETQRVKDQPFHCPLCNNNFEQKGAFGSHMKTHCVETYDKDHIRVSMRCKLCQNVFSERSDFMEHADSCPGRRDKQNQNQSSPQHHQARIRCKFANCSHIFQSRSSMLKHYAIHHGRKMSCIFKSSQTLAKKTSSAVGSKGVTQPKAAGSGFNVTFRCTRCRKSFSCQADWMRHKMAKHSFFCGKCGKKFTSRSSFQAHIEKDCFLLDKNTNPNEPVTCKLCKRQFSQLYNLQKHMPYCKNFSQGSPTHDNLPVKCELCKKQLSCTKALINHKDFCKKRRRQKLREEKEKAANNGSSSNDSNAITKVDSDCEKKKKVIVNGASSKLLSPSVSSGKEQEVKKEEKKEPQRFLCGLCGIVITDETRFQQHKKICTDTYNCEGCGAKFKTQAKYIEHKDAHTKCISIDDMFVEEIHACGACSEKFNTPQKVTKHANIAHKGSENQKALALFRRDLRQCQVCKLKINKFDEPYYHHMWMKHGVKSNFHSAYYKCDLCHKRYIDPRDFEAHEATHEENKMRHACTLCELKFRRKQLLDRHMSEKHGGGKVKQE